MTSSRGGVLQGRQQPRVEHRPPWVSEDAADEAIDLAASVGLILDPWQQAVVRAALAERADGSWAANEVGFLVARQNGKGGALEAIVLHGMFLVGDPLTLWTAHQTKTAFEAFLRIRGWVDGSDDLRRLVAKVSLANGDEGIELRSGVRLRFVARSKSSGRGFSPQRIIFDEAQELSSLAVDAMLPAMSAQPNWQAVYTGTVPGPENNAEHFTRVRDRGRAGKSDRLAWLEWTPAGSDDPRAAAGLDLDDRRAWRAANPALGYRIRESGIAAERESMSPESFAKERLSVWPTVAGGSGVVDMAWWAACESPPEPVEGPLVLVVETTPHRETTYIVVVGGCADGVPQVEVVAAESGTSWVPERVARIAAEHGAAAVVMDGRGAAASLIPDVNAEVEPLNLEVVTTTAGDVAAACGQMFDAIRDGTFRHLGDAALTAAVSSVETRPLGDGMWAWKRTGPATAPLVAATLGLWKWRDLAQNSYDPLANIF